MTTACRYGHPKADHQPAPRTTVRTACALPCRCAAYTPRPIAIRAALWRVLTANNPAYPADGEKR